jgi:peptidoglycan/LPS O-acetylase OafA/YrhL
MTGLLASQVACFPCKASTARVPRKTTLMSAAAHALSHPKYRPDIDGLRAVAVVSVVAFHAAPDWIAGGFIGVDIFFVISGFLISTILFNNLERNTFSLREFYARRIQRIFPSLVVVLTATYAMGWWVLLANEFAQLGKHIVAGALFVSNLALWGESGYFDAAAETKPLLHLWSLGIEEQFYIVWPLLLLVGWNRRYNLLTLTLVLGGLSMWLNLKGMAKNPTATFYAPQTRFWELLAGSFLAWAWLHPHAKTRSLSNAVDRWIHRMLYRDMPSGDGKALANALSVIGVILLAFGVFRIKAAFGFPGKWAIVPVLGAVCIISAGPTAWFNRIVLSSRPAVWLGLISFPLYLWHWPLLAFARVMEEGLPSAQIRIAAVVLAVVLAWLTYRLVERPLRFGARKRLKILVLCGLMACIGAVGYYTFSKAGLVFGAQSRITNALLEQIVEPPNTGLSDGSCEKYLQFSLGPGAVCLTNSSAPQVLFVGDSHAMSLNSAAVLGKVAIQSMLIGNHGCAPLMSHSIMEGKVNKGCNALPDEALKVLSRFPTIQTVVLDSRGPLYFSGQGYGVEGASNYSIFALDGSSGATQAEMFRKGYSEFAAALLALHKQVVVVIDPPELGEDPRACVVVRPVSLSPKTLSSCTQSRSKVDERQAVYRQLVAQIQADNPGLAVYDPIDLFCDDAQCYGLRNGNLLYWDDDHISTWASELVLTDMQKRKLLP